MRPMRSAAKGIPRIRAHFKRKYEIRRLLNIGAAVAPANARRQLASDSTNVVIFALVSYSLDGSC
jgi:hypothetical protein